MIIVRARGICFDRRCSLPYVGVLDAVRVMEAIR